METIYKLYNMYFTKCTRAEYDAATKNNNTQYIVKETNGDISLYLGTKSLISTNDYTDEDKEKVSFLPNETTQNDFNKAFQSDWNETNQNSLAYIKNKPTFSDNLISISGEIESTNSNVEFISSDYTSSDLTRINQYMNKSASAEDDTLKYDFYLDRIINTDDKEILQKLVDGTWKKVITTVNTKINSIGNNKFVTTTSIKFVPTNLYTYNNSTNTWDATENTNNESFIYFMHSNNIHKFELMYINYKYLYAYNYNLNDISRVNDIISGIGGTISESEFLKYDINMDGIIDSTDLSYIEKFIPSITTDYWKSVYITRSYRFGQEKYAAPNYSKSQDSNIIITLAVLWYMGKDDTTYVQSRTVDLDHRTILDVRNINIPKVNAAELVKSPKGEITTVDSTTGNIITVNSTNTNSTNIAASKLTLPDSGTGNHDITKVDSTATAISNTTSSDNNSIPTSYAVKDFVSNFPISQVNADWDETNQSSPAYIENKPDLNDYTDADTFNSLDKKLQDSFYYSAFSGSNINPLAVNNTLTFNSTKTHSVLVFGSLGGCDFGVVCGLHYVLGNNNQIVARRIQGMISTSDANYSSPTSPSNYYSALLDIWIDLGNDNDGNNPNVTAINAKTFKNGVVDTVSLSIYIVRGIG